VGTKGNDDQLAARLLSGRDEPSVLEQEAIFERVMQRVAPPRRALWRSTWPLAVAAAAALLLWRPLSGGSPAADELLARGGAESGTLQLGCSDPAGKTIPCSLGMKVDLALTPPRGRRYFALLAQRPDGKLIWYYPKQAGSTPRVGERVGLYPEAPVLDAKGPAGSYQWVAVFSSQALTRPQLKTRLKGDLTGDPSLTLIRRTLSVQAPRVAGAPTHEGAP
jgi:hypothetical protein